MEISIKPTEQLKEDFTNWLIEQSPKDFKSLNGFEIFKPYVKFRYGNSINFERKDFQYLVNNKRDIIDEIKVWLDSFHLTFEDYKIYFELYLEEPYLNLKPSFQKTIESFNLYLNDESFLFKKEEIVKKELFQIFEQKIKNKVESKKTQNKNQYSYYINENISNITNINNLNCINCGDELTIKEKAFRGRNKSICSECRENNEITVSKEINKNCIECNCDLTEEEQQRKHMYKNICLKCLESRKKNYKKNYKLLNPEKTKAQKNRYKRNRIKRDPTFKILHRLRTRILLVLNGKKKAESSMNLLGCTADDFKKHIESQFKDDMSWENYGIKGWHIDHIRPCASFDLSIAEEQKKCFHYTNLQPLWWFDNLSKRDKIL